MATTSSPRRCWWNRAWGSGATGSGRDRHRADARGQRVDVVRRRRPRVRSLRPRARDRRRRAHGQLTGNGSPVSSKRLELGEHAGPSVAHHRRDGAARLEVAVQHGELHRLAEVFDLECHDRTSLRRDLRAQRLVDATRDGPLRREACATSTTTVGTGRFRSRPARGSTMLAPLNRHTIGEPTFQSVSNATPPQ